MTTNYIPEVTAIIEAVIGQANAQPRVNLRLDGAPNYYADVKNGRAPRGLPLTGSHEMYRMADELDREAAELVVVFDISGFINGIEYDKVTVWINGGRVSLPTLFHGTDKARSRLYNIGREVSELVSRDALLMTDAWIDHLDRLAVKLDERAAFIDAVRVELDRSMSATLAGSVR
jgi:hypothetical protein